jgi:hypothetical protein
MIADNSFAVFATIGTSSGGTSAMKTRGFCDAAVEPPQDTTRSVGPLVVAVTCNRRCGFANHSTMGAMCGTEAKEPPQDEEFAELVNLLNQDMLSVISNAQVGWKQGPRIATLFHHQVSLADV